MWGLWWTKQHWGRFSPSILISSANHHSTNLPIIIITQGGHNRPIGGRSAEWTPLDSTPHYINFFKKCTVDLLINVEVGFIRTHITFAIITTQASSETWGHPDRDLLTIDPVSLNFMKRFGTAYCNTGLLCR
jgi:hypothetical protein